MSDVASSITLISDTRKLTLLSGALAVVLLAAFAWVAVAEFFDHRIYSAEALERYAGVPTIGMIPKARAARLRHAIRPAVAAAEQW